MACVVGMVQLKLPAPFAPMAVEAEMVELSRPFLNSSILTVVPMVEAVPAQVHVMGCAPVAQTSPPFGLVTVIAGVGPSKVAPAVKSAEASVSVQTGLVVNAAHAPVQPVKVWLPAPPVVGVAVSVTVAPSAKLLAQVPVVQLMPGMSEETVPVPPWVELSVTAM